MSRRAYRHASRQVALQVLYAVDLAGGREPAPGPAPGVEETFAAVAENFSLPEGARAFAKELVFGVMERRDELDARIARHAVNWRLSRMAAVDRNVLRLGSWELAYSDTPVSVVIDQAVELAHRFGGDPSPAFVNGVLDAVARELGTARETP